VQKINGNRLPKQVIEWINGKTKEKKIKYNIRNRDTKDDKWKEFDRRTMADNGAEHSNPKLCVYIYNE